MFDERPDLQPRFDGELVVWMTTVNPSGQPQTSPVWFLIEDDVFVIYSLDGTPRTRNIAANPRVSLNLNSTREGGQVVAMEARAEIVADGPPAHEVERYVQKYVGPMQAIGKTPESFAAAYPVRIEVRPTRMRGW